MFPTGICLSLQHTTPKQGHPSLRDVESFIINIPDGYTSRDPPRSNGSARRTHLYRAVRDGRAFFRSGRLPHSPGPYPCAAGMSVGKITQAQAQAYSWGIRYRW